MAGGNGSKGLEEEDFGLGEASWKELILAAHEVEKILLDDVEASRGGASIMESNLAQLMPRRFIPKYDTAFMERLAQSAADLAERLQKARADDVGYPYATFLNSVAEEMLTSQIIQLAIAGSGSPEDAEELEALQELSFEDRDFEWLYDLSYDGVTDDPDVSTFAGFANLSFEDWFKPFRSQAE